MCSIIGVGERLHKVLGQIDLAHWTQVSDRCPLGYLLLYVRCKSGVTFIRRRFRDALKNVYKIRIQRDFF